jgi:hypothetical protein
MSQLKLAGKRIGFLINFNAPLNQERHQTSCSLILNVVSWCLGG